MKIKIVILLFFLLIPFFLFSLEIEYPPLPGIPVPAPEITFAEYVRYLFNLAIRIVGLITLAVIIWGGILYLTSGGDANQKADAKNKITGAFLGLFVLLCSYLILYTINPQLLVLSLQRIEPREGILEGIYLRNAARKEIHVHKTTDKLGLTDATEIEFISPPTSLLAVYLYDGEKLRGIERRIINRGTGIKKNIVPPLPKSIYFLWNRPGVYLCPTTTTDPICPKRPLRVVGSIPDLSATEPFFNDKAESLQIIGNYQAVLFSKPGFEGECSYVFNENAPDLSASTTLLGHNQPPIGKGIVSSIIASLRLVPEEEGNVTFYNRINCQGGSRTLLIRHNKWQDLSPAALEFNDETLVYENILSFKINCPCAVLLNTETNGAGVCQFFKKPKGETRCVPSLVGEAVYQPQPEPPASGNQTKKVRSVYILYFGK